MVKEYLKVQKMGLKIKIKSIGLKMSKHAIILQSIQSIKTNTIILFIRYILKKLFFCLKTMHRKIKIFQDYFHRPNTSRHLNI